MKNDPQSFGVLLVPELCAYQRDEIVLALGRLLIHGHCQSIVPFLGNSNNKFDGKAGFN